MIWPEIRAKYIFSRKDVRGVSAPLASATKEGVFLREDLDGQVWNPGDDVSNFKLVEPGDFVIGLRSFQHGISFSEVRGLVSPAYTVLRVIAQVDLRFYKYYFRSSILISLLENVSQGIRQGRTIDYEAFSNLLIPLPSLEEQSGIANALDKAEELEMLAARQLELLAERKQALITAAVTGQIDVTTARGADVS